MGNKGHRRREAKSTSLMQAQIGAAPAGTLLGGVSRQSLKK